MEILPDGAVEQAIAFSWDMAVAEFDGVYGTQKKRTNKKRTSYPLVN